MDIFEFFIGELLYALRRGFRVLGLIIVSPLYLLVLICDWCAEAYQDAVWRNEQR